MPAARVPFVVVALLALLVPARTSARADEAAGKTFHFGTHDARTNIAFVSEADLETIHGFVNKAQGQVAVGAQGRSAAGWIRVPVAALRTGIDLRDEHLRSEQWMDAARHPWILLRLQRARMGEDGRTWSYQGTLEIKGVSRPVAGTALIRFVPADLAQRARLGPGTWVRVKTRLQVRLSEYGIQVPEGIGPKVSDLWDVSIDMYGTSEPPPPAR